MDSNIKGMVFDIKRFSMHDGPGIRSTLFTKGCPLRCPWCQNPEGLEKRLRLWYFENKCIRCESCVKNCPNGAITVNDNAEGPFILIDHAKCKNISDMDTQDTSIGDSLQCETCVEACPAKALSLDGRIMTVRQAVEELMKDKDFYDTSGGGVTISGGEPLMQHEFNYEVLRTLKEKGIHTTIETSLYADNKVLEKFIDVVDLFITDIKIFDEKTHKKTIGVSNKRIKENFEFLAAKGVKLLVRIPLIPGYTVENNNLARIAEYVNSVREDICIELINYNPLPISKYRIMNKEYEFDKDVQPFSEKQMDEFRKIIRDKGIKVIKE